MHGVDLWVAGFLVADPELRYTPSGAAVVNFTVAYTPRFFDKDAGEWKDSETLFLRCSAWNRLAENVADSLRKGQPVFAAGSLKARGWDTAEGERRTSWELTAVAVGPNLINAVAEVRRDGKASGGGGASASPAAGGGRSQAGGFESFGQGQGPGQGWGQQPGGQQQGQQQAGGFAPAGGQGWGAPVPEGQEEEPPF